MVSFDLLTKHGDGGDSCNRTCAAALAALYSDLKVDTGFLKQLNHPDKPWLWRRHSHPQMWYADWDRMSRDQAIPLVILFGEARLYRYYLWFLFGHFIRLFLFMTNTRRNFVYTNYEDHVLFSTPDVPWRPQWKLPDLTGPEFWALEIRALPAPLRWAAYPVLNILDVETLLGSVYRRFFNSTNHDIINHTLVLINARRRCPTILSWLAGKITNARFCQERLNSFFTQDGEPPLNVLLYSSVKRYL